MKNIKKLTIGILIFAVGLVCTYAFFSKYLNQHLSQIERVNYSSGLGSNQMSGQITDTKVKVNTKEFKIIAFGDSLTAGLGIDLKDSYPSMLENALNNSSEYKKYNLTFNVINMGVSGETSAGGLDRVDFVIQQKPDLVLLGLGANDMLRSIDPVITYTNIDKVIKKIVTSNTPIILLGMQSVSSNGRQYKIDFESIYPTLAKKYNIPIVKFFLDGVALIPDFNISDGIHPNKSGYEVIVNKNIIPILNPTMNSILEKKFENQE